jgi:hypothetical protein
MIRHIVLFRWNENTSSEDKAQTVKAFQALAGEVPGRDLYVGNDVAGRGTFDWGLTADFGSKDEIPAYSFIKPHVAAMEVLDFEFGGE